MRSKARKFFYLRFECALSQLFFLLTSSMFFDCLAKILVCLLYVLQHSVDTSMQGETAAGKMP